MKLVEITVLISLVLAIALLLTYGYRYIIPGEAIRSIGYFYLYTTYNPNVNYTALSPKTVTAILWDYRGLDTLFETAVLYLAIVAALTLGRGLYSESYKEGRGEGLSVIVKSVTKITAPMIITVGISIAIHVHPSPGGGFQGGATIAVVPMLIIVIFSVLFIVKRGVLPSRMILVQCIGLSGIGLVAILLYVIGLIIGQPAYVFQNLAKPDAPLSMPPQIAGVETSGTLWFFDLFEMIAVMAGFMVVFTAIILMKYER